MVGSPFMQEILSYVTFYAYFYFIHKLRVIYGQKHFCAASDARFRTAWAVIRIGPESSAHGMPCMDSHADFRLLRMYEVDNAKSACICMHSCQNQKATGSHANICTVDGCLFTFIKAVPLPHFCTWLERHPAKTVHCVI